MHLANQANELALALADNSPLLLSGIAVVHSDESENKL